MNESEYPKPIEVSFDTCKNEKELINYLEEIIKQSFLDFLIFGEVKYCYTINKDKKYDE